MNLIAGSWNDTCGYYNYHRVCIPPLIQTHPSKQTSNESYGSSAGVELQRLTQEYHSSNEYTKITVTNTHRQRVCKRSYKFYLPIWLWHMQYTCQTCSYALPWSFCWNSQAHHYYTSLYQFPASRSCPGMPQHRGDMVGFYWRRGEKYA